MDQTTNFANSKKRMIRLSAKGKPYVMTADGKKQYSPKAAFRKNATSGALRRLDSSNKGNMPKAIMPAGLAGRKTRSNAGTKGVRKTRSNKGMKRGPQPVRALANIMAGRFNTPAPKVRKVRSNKGVKRSKVMVASPGGTVYRSKAAATRRKTVPKRLRANPFASLMLM
jgi:hypothetical protein